MIKTGFISILSLLMMACAAQAQHQPLRTEIDRIARSSSGKVGVSIRLLETNDTLTYHNNYHYPMQSVFKFAIAMDVLHEVDKGKLKLNQAVYVTKADLPKTVSALYEKYPQGNVKVSIKELLTDMVTLSDNDACDILIKQLGDPDQVTQYVHSIGINSIYIKANEAQMASAWPVQYGNWCQPSAQTALLAKLYHQTALSKASNDLLWQLMLATYVAPKRIRGLLPKGTPVAHRSGTSSTNDEGLSPATNDVGIIILPNGKHLAISIFVADSHDNDETRDLVIARIAKAAYDEFDK